MENNVHNKNDGFVKNKIKIDKKNTIMNEITEYYNNKKITLFDKIR